MSNLVYIGPAEQHPDVTEALASAVIAPRIVMVLTSGQFALAGAAAVSPVYIADRNVLGELTDSYAIGDTVQGFRPKSGEYYALTLAASQTIVKDGPLKTDATGKLVAQGGTGNILCYADQAVTTGSGVTAEIRVYFA